MNKRRILIASLVVCLAAIMAFGSLAYFTAQDRVQNKFYTAAYDPTDPDKPITGNDLFSIKVYETDNTKTDGTKTESGNTYEKIQPGDVLAKDPTVENTGKYDAYIRVNVTFDKAAEWENIIPEDSELTALFGGIDSAKWTQSGKIEDTTANTVTYSYYLNEALAPDATATLFSTVTIPTYINATQFATIASFNITITADAIQSANTGTVTEAFGIYDTLE